LERKQQRQLQKLSVAKSSMMTSDHSDIIDHRPLSVLEKLDPNQGDRQIYT
jgi:hypothetical protein